MAHTVDIRGGEVKALPHSKATIARRTVDRQALLAHAASDHRDGARGDIVVVKAGVVVVHPADQPRGQVRVGEQLLVDALGVIVVDASDPQLRLRGELGDERLQLGRGQVPVARAGYGGEGGSHRRASSRATGTLGVCASKARAVASASSSQSSAPGSCSNAGSTTGRSDPYRSWPGPPIASARAPTASGPYEDVS